MTELLRGKRIRQRVLLLPLLLLLIACLGGCGRKESRQEPRETVTAQAPQMQGLEETDGGTEDDEAESSVDSGQEQEDDRGEGSGQEAPDPGSGGSQGEISENGVYTTAEDVALYLHTYGRLPLNFMTKKEARAKGWTHGSLEEYAPGMCIGGDFFGNYEGVLPEGNYHECDINTLGADSRGPERLVYSDDGRIYYTNDHYESFRLLYDGK